MTEDWCRRFAMLHFVQELDHQCEVGLEAAASILGTLIGNWPAPVGPVFTQVNTFLTAAGNVSKLFWPPPIPRKMPALNYPDRAAWLKRSLSTTDDSPLSHRGLRNTVEHLDYYVDQWLGDVTASASEGRGVGVILSRCVTDPGAIIVTGSDEHNLLRLDRPSLTVTFHRETYGLKPLIAELERLRPLAAQLAASMHAQLGTEAGAAIGQWQADRAKG
jgi:hypothetical protein